MGNDYDLLKIIILPGVMAPDYDTRTPGAESGSAWV
jgi:hypothetical protein